MNDKAVTPRRGADVLAVDRNLRNLALLTPYLEREGFRVRTAAGYEALDLVLNSADLPDLVLIDLTGLDGGIWERCERLYAAHIPIVVVSSVQSAAIRQASLAHGARAVLTKPLVMQHLLDIIDGLLGSRHAAHPAADGT